MIACLVMSCCKGGGAASSSKKGCCGGGAVEEKKGGCCGGDDAGGCCEPKKEITFVPEPQGSGIAPSCPSDTSEAGAAPGCQGCEGQSACSGGREEAVDEKLRVRMGAVKKKILVLSGKGGVGKSTVACQLAGELARSGRRTGLLDLDLCGPSIAHMMGVEEFRMEARQEGWTPARPEGFEGRLAVVSLALMLPTRESAVVWRGPRKHATIVSFLRDVFWSRLDYLLVDTPPGTSDEHLTAVTALRGLVDGAVLVTTPSETAVATLRRELDFCRRQNVPVLGVVENMKGFACPCCGREEQIFAGSSSFSSVEEFAKERGIAYLGSVPLDMAMAEGADRGSCVKSDAMSRIAARVRQLTGGDEDDF